MELHPGGIEPYRPRPATDGPVDPALWQASFDQGETYVTAQVLTDLIPEGEPTWLLAHATADTPPGDATVMPDLEWVEPLIGYHDGEKFIVRSAPVVYLT